MLSVSVNIFFYAISVYMALDIPGVDIRTDYKLFLLADHHRIWYRFQYVTLLRRHYF